LFHSKAGSRQLMARPDGLSLCNSKIPLKPTWNKTPYGSIKNNACWNRLLLLVPSNSYTESTPRTRGGNHDLAGWRQVETLHPTLGGTTDKATPIATNTSSRREGEYCCASKPPRCSLPTARTLHLFSCHPLAWHGKLQRT
jgi:hypothetical protein